LKIDCGNSSKIPSLTSLVDFSGILHRETPKLASRALIILQMDVTNTYVNENEEQSVGRIFKE